jgi:hypothetical protein
MEKSKSKVKRLNIQFVASGDNKSKYEYQSRIDILGDTIYWTIKMFNFIIDTPENLCSYKKIPKRFRPITEQCFSLATADTFLQSNSVTAPETFFIWTISSDGKISIKAQSTLNISYGAHTIYSTSFEYKAKVNCHQSSKCNKSKNWTPLLQFQDFLAFDIPGQTLSPTFTFHKKKSALYEVDVPSLLFIANDTASPQNSFDFSLGNIITTEVNLLPSKWTTKIQDRAYVLQGTYTDPNGNQSSSQAILMFNIFGQIMLFSTPQFYFLPGTYSFPATTIVYRTGTNILENEIQIQPLTIQKEFSDISNWPQDPQLVIGYRDSSVNDSAHGFAVHSWISNDEQPNKMDPVTNCYVARVDLDCEGKIVKRYPRIQVSQNTVTNPGEIFDVSVGISRYCKNIVVVSWVSYDMYAEQIIVPGVIQEFVGSLYYVISYDGGFHFSEPYILVEGITNTQTVEDPRGVFADDDGGFWMITKIIKVDTVNSLNSLPNVYFYFNDHNGAPNHWKLIYQTTDGNTGFYDYPQITYGIHGTKKNSKTRGLWWVTDFLTFSFETEQKLGFIPSPKYGTPAELIVLPQNQLTVTTQLAITPKGRLFISGPNNVSPNQSVQGLIIREPGLLTDLSLVRPCITLFDNIFSNGGAQPPYPYPLLYPSQDISYDSGFSITVRGLQYDSKRCLLYAVLNLRPNRSTQDFYQFLIASKDGFNWSAPLFLPKYHKGNRGFFSMALNRNSSSLEFGWYDSINSSTGTGIQFFAGYLSSSELDLIQGNVECTDET